MVRTNLEICFPELDDFQRLELERRAFESFGMGMAEMAAARWTPHGRLQNLGQVEGIEHLQAALARGKGVLLVSAHMTCLEICAYLLQRRIKTGFSFREQKNPLLDLVLRRTRPDAERPYKVWGYPVVPILFLLVGLLALLLLAGAIAPGGSTATGFSMKTCFRASTQASK